MTLTPWMAHALATRDGAPLGARHPKPNLCPTCSAWTLIALDGDVLAHTARVDPTPLTPAGELACTLTGRATYDLSTAGGRFQLDHRDRYAIRSRPPAAPGARYDVLPAHDHSPPLTGALVTGTVHDHPTPADHGDRVPF